MPIIKHNILCPDEVYLGSNPPLPATQKGRHSRPHAWWEEVVERNAAWFARANEVCPLRILNCLSRFFHFDIIKEITKGE